VTRRKQAITLRNAEEIFRSHFPKARITSNKGNDGSRHYLVYKSYTDRSYVGCGDRKTYAWKDACESCNLTGIKDAVDA
jgi:hypothetical protein